MRVNRGTLAMAGLSVLTLVAGSPQIRRGEAARPEAHGRHSVEELRKRTVEVCRTLDNRQEPHTIIPCAALSSHSDGAIQHVLRMDCLNAAGESIATCVWDADTAELLYVSNQAAKVRKRGGTALDERQAVDLGRIWMTKLGVAQRGARWTLSGAPRRMEYDWRFWWQSGDWIVSLFIDAKSGDLKVARARRASWRPHSA